MAYQWLNETERYLNELLASLAVLESRFHQFHWYVSGPAFFTLHEKFDEYYAEAGENIDEVAERILQLGGKPLSTLQEFIDHSWFKEEPYTNDVKASDMIDYIFEDLTSLQAHLVDGLNITSDENDDVTNDILVGMKASVDKQLWMLRAYKA